MKKSNLLFLVTTILVSVFSLQCCKSESDDYAMDNQFFITQVSSNNSFELAAGNLAQTKGKIPELKKYGAHMVTEHTAVRIEMMDLAQTKGWVISSGLQPEEQDDLNTLSAASAENFDHEYLRVLADAQQRVIDLFIMAANKGGARDADLRNFAAGTLPILRAHLEEAQTLQAAVAP